MSASVTKKGPGLAALKALLEKTARSEVLVGIPAKATLRQGEPINNASLLYVLSKGSPLQSIPPRPVLEPAVADAKNLITPPLEEAARAVLQQNPARAELELNRAGALASNAAKRWITSSGKGSWPPNAPMTIALKGSDKPLIDTGSLRRSLTWVVKENA